MQKPATSVDIAHTLGVETRPGRRWKRYAAVAVLLLAVLAAVLFFYSRWNGAGKGTQYQTREVALGNLTVTVSATGNLAPTGEVDVGSELSGIINRVEVDFNDRVKKGQPLAYLDDTKFAAAVRGSKAVLASAKAQLSQAQATVLQKQQNLDRLRRAKALSDGKALSPYDLESAEADLERALADRSSAEAAILRAEADLEVDESNLSKTVIYSPVNGTVLLRSIDPGQTVAASLQAPVLFTLAEDLSHMELQVDVDEADVGVVHAGQEATFTVDAYPDRLFEAHIIKVRFGSAAMQQEKSSAGATSAGVVTYTTSLSVDNPDLALRPGMTATAEIVVNKISDALLVPNAALRFTPPLPETVAPRRGIMNVLLPRPPMRRPSAGAASKARQPKVWILKAGEPEPVPVTTGASDGVHTVITGAALPPGTPVIVDMSAAK